jgi:hypothetical protein
MALTFFYKTSAASRIALLYITGGALIIIWSLVWAVYLFNHPPETSAVFYWVSGVFLTGLVLFGIGLAVGSIGRSARRADTTSEVVTPDTPATSVVANANGVPVTSPVTPAAPVTSPATPAVPVVMNHPVSK